MKNLIPISLTLFVLLLPSCSGSKVQIKPEQGQVNSIRQDTNLITSKKLFSEQTLEMTTDTVIIPKRKKSEKQQQIILAPIILPITTTTTLQMPEQKSDKLGTEEKPKPIPEAQPPKTEPVGKEYKSIETPKISKPKEIVGYSIQIGAFVTENSANEHLKNFKKLYPSKNAYILLDSVSGLYKVRVNSIKDSTELEQMISLIRENFPDAFIVPSFARQEPQIKPQFEEATNVVKIQVGIYSQLSGAMEIKEYLESKFNIKSEIIKSDEFYKVVAFLNEDNKDILNTLKSEFPDAFVIK